MRASMLGLLALVTLSCDAGSTTPPGTSCGSRADCPPGQACTDGRCAPDRPPVTCADASDCPAGQLCEGGECVERDPSSACSSSDDCSGGEVCSTVGVCIPPGTCRGPGDCPDVDQFCSAARTCIDGGTCASTEDCEEGTICDLPTSECVPGSDCGGAELVAEPVVPNLMLVLDRSCSMTQDGGGDSKWALAVAAIDNLTTAFEDQVRWGLILFPDKGDSNDCRQNGDGLIPVGEGMAPAIRMQLGAALAMGDRFYPSGPCVTNIDRAMQQADAQPELDDPERSSFVMLITDGKQSGSCGGTDGDRRTEAAITALNARGIHTYVVGFGGDRIDPAQLSTFATLGGTARPGDPAYYQADDGAELERQLAEIVGSLVSCELALADPPEDPSAIYVWFDDVEEIERDETHASGWDYDPATMSITLYGEPCERLQRGEVDDVDIVFGCPGPVIE